VLTVDVYVEEERLYGSLHVIVNKLQGLTKPERKLEFHPLFAWFLIISKQIHFVERMF